MTRLRRAPLGIVGVASLLLVAMLGAAAAGDDYSVQVLLPSASKVVEGSPVMVDGFEAGTVTGLEVRDGQALVSLDLDDDFAPLHEGAEVLVSWKAALSERQVEVVDGPQEAAEVPDDGTLEGQMPKPMEIDDVLLALDEPTRRHVQGLVTQLSDTLRGRETDVRSTLTTAGPTVEALGAVLRALGTDGPAIRNLVRRVDTMMGTLAARDQQLSRITGNLALLTERVVEQRTQLDASLRALPDTLSQARDTLDLVPSVVDETVPLLEDLESPTARLRPVARTLRPLLNDLAPLTADLRPTLAAAERVLGLTPSLLDSAHDVLPGLTDVVKGVKTPLASVRPYTPEAIAMLSTWASAFSNYGPDGHFARIIPQAGLTTPVVNPGVMPPGLTYDPYPDPGALVGQPWTDAFGSEIR